MRIKPSLANHTTCTGCMACVDSCPHKALNAVIAHDGHYYVHWDQEKCINCGLCSKTCPIISKKNPLALEKNLYAAWSNDEVLRMNSSSGGVFAAIAVSVLKQGGIVFGATMIGTNVIHRAITKIEDIKLLQGSKYQEGNLSGIYKEVRQYLKADKYVLFSGMPCQIAGLYSFLGECAYQKLLTIDLVCGGLPSINPMNAFLQHTDKSIKTIKSFRDKTHGWKSIGYKYALITQNNDNTESNYGYNNCVLLAFSSHMGNRYSCNNCRFTYYNHFSDLTIADFWGDKSFPEQHYQGLSAVISHTPQGEKLLLDADLTIHKANLKNCLYNNPRMVYGRAGIPGMKRLAHVFSTRYFLYMPHPTGAISLQIYRAIAKIYNHIEFIFHHRKITSQIKKIADHSKKKVALLTFHHSLNYGAICQTYATYKALESIGYQVQIIDLRIKEHYSLIQNAIGLLRILRFAKFRHTYYPQLTCRYKSIQDLQANPPKADIYLVGSDQTWNPLITNSLSEAFWLNFGTAKTKRIGFSVSFGQDYWPIKDTLQTSIYKKLAQRFSQISVREEQGIKLCHDLFGINPIQTLDPTLLMNNFEEITGRINPGHYIASYKFISTSNYYECLKELGVLYNKPIKLLGRLKPIRGFKYHYPQSISKWIIGIAAAEMVLTDSFHGVAISIIYHRNFIAFVGDTKRIGRIQNLLKQLGLEDRLYTETTINITKVKQLLDKPIDYTSVEKRLNILRNKSFDFLQNM